MHYRIIEPKDNLILANIIRDNLKANKLDIPGTVYFDENLNNLSDFYQASPQRAYFIALDDNDNIIGGIGLIEKPKEVVHSSMNRFYLKELV